MVTDTILDIRKGLSRPLTVTGHERDLSDDEVVVYLCRGDQKHEIGSATGAASGTDFVINLDFDVEPGYYHLRLFVRDGDIVHPQDGEDPSIQVLATNC
jgi:hypothetical protein